MSGKFIQDLPQGGGGGITESTKLIVSNNGTDLLVGTVEQIREAITQQVYNTLLPKIYNDLKEKLMPDYENGISSTSNQSSGTQIQVNSFSFVYLRGRDPYMEDYLVQVSPDKTNWYVVGSRQDDVNSNTQGTSFLFPIPSKWYFRCTAENGFIYTVYPLKGENA